VSERCFGVSVVHPSKNLVLTAPTPRELHRERIGLAWDDFKQALTFAARVALWVSGPALGASGSQS
jgi:hypothetical protein